MVFRSDRFPLPRTLFSLPAVSLLAFGACAGPASEPETISVSAAVSAKKGPNGEALFNTAFANTNGRSCAN